MKKIIKYLLTIIFSFSFITKVFAVDYNITVTSNSVTVGNSVTLKINGTGIIGRFNISSSNSNIASLSGNMVWIEDNTQSITINTKNVGTAVITVTPDKEYGLSDTMGTEPNLVPKTITITVKEKPKPNNNTTSGSSNKPSSGSSGSNTVAKPKSSNSYLSSLTIDGYELNNPFDKENLEYSVTLKEGTEKIKINAQLADSTAKVTGVGEVSVSEGINTFSIVVTAENGSKRIYTLKATVLEYQPIKAKVNKDEYSVVRKRKDLPSISEYFVEKDIIIGENIVEGYYNENLKYEVVGLKDNTGSIKYYIYDKGKYTLYNEQVFNGMVLRILEKEIDNGYKKTSFSYNNTKITSYQEVKLDILKNTYALDNNEISGNNFYLFYAINLETGKEELYQYDSLEKTVQRYNTLILDMYKEQSNKYYFYLLCSLLTLGGTIVIFSIIIICNNKKRRIKNSKKKYDKIDESI